MKCRKVGGRAPETRPSVAADRVAEDDEVAVGRDDGELALVVGFVGGAMDPEIEFRAGCGRERVELRLQLGIERVDVAHVDIIAEPPVPRRGAVPPVILEHPDPAPFPLDIGIIRLPPKRLESEHVAEERHRRLDVGYVHERGDLEEIGHDVPLQTTELRKTTFIGPDRAAMHAET